LVERGCSRNDEQPRLPGEVVVDRGEARRRDPSTAVHANAHVMDARPCMYVDEPYFAGASHRHWRPAVAIARDIHRTRRGETNRNPIAPRAKVGDRERARYIGRL